MMVMTSESNGKIKRTVVGEQLTLRAEIADNPPVGAVNNQGKLSQGSEPCFDDDMCYPDNHLDDDERYFLFPGSDSE